MELSMEHDSLAVGVVHQDASSSRPLGHNQGAFTWESSPWKALQYPCIWGSGDKPWQGDIVTLQCLTPLCVCVVLGKAVHSIPWAEAGEVDVACYKDSLEDNWETAAVYHRKSREISCCLQWQEDMMTLQSVSDTRECAQSSFMITSGTSCRCCIKYTACSDHFRGGTGYRIYRDVDKKCSKCTLVFNMWE